MGTFEGQKFDEGITELKRFMKERLSWMDEQFASVESLRKSFGYYANSSLIWISEVDQAPERGKVRIVVETEVPEGTAVSLQVNGTNFYTASLEDGKLCLKFQTRRFAPAATWRRPGLRERTGNGL